MGVPSYTFSLIEDQFRKFLSTNPHLDGHIQIAKLEDALAEVHLNGQTSPVYQQLAIVKDSYDSAVSRVFLDIALISAMKDVRIYALSSISNPRVVVDIMKDFFIKLGRAESIVQWPEGKELDDAISQIGDSYRRLVSEGQVYVDTWIMYNQLFERIP